jgi:hypothetical protein
MLWARLSNAGVVVETLAHPTDPTPLFDPSWTWVEAPAEAVQGSMLVDAVWTHPDASVEPSPPPAEPPRRKTLTPPEFLLQFSATERIAIRAAAAYQGEDASRQMLAAFVADWLQIIADPRLTVVDLSRPDTIEGVEYLAMAGLITVERAAEILRGVAS